MNLSYLQWIGTCIALMSCHAAIAPDGADGSAANEEGDANACPLLRWGSNGLISDLPSGACNVQQESCTYGVTRCPRPDASWDETWKTDGYTCTCTASKVWDCKEISFGNGLCEIDAGLGSD